MLLAFDCALAIKMAPAVTAMATMAAMTTAISVEIAPRSSRGVDTHEVHVVFDGELHELDVGLDCIHLWVSFLWVL